MYDKKMSRKEKRLAAARMALEKAVGKLKLVPRNHPLIRSSKDMGISFGD